MGNTGSGLATIFYNQMASVMINPSNKSAAIYENGEKFFESAIADRILMY